MTEASDKREKLVQAAAELFHTQGINSTSLKDIADKAGVPLGNVYYYFRTKDDLGLAAAEEQMQRLRSLLHSLEEQSSDPRERIIGSIKFFDNVKESFTQYGCPVAKVCQSTKPDTDPVGRSYANVYRKHLEWLEKQFAEIGYIKEANEFALSIIIRVQGAGLMAKALVSAKIISDELSHLERWVRELP